MRRPAILATAIAAVVVALVGGYAVYWHLAARTLEDGIARWAAAQRTDGYEVSYGTPRIGGFPFRLEAELATPALARPASPPPAGRPWRWQGPTLTLVSRPWAPLDAEAFAPGRHDLTLGAGGDRHHYVLDATTAGGSAAFGLDGRLTAASVKLGGILVTEEGHDERTVLAESAMLRIEPGTARDGHTEPSLSFGLELAELVLPPEADTPLGRTLDRLALDGAVLGAIDTQDRTPREALARWRDGGGTVELDRIVAHWGPLELTGSATLALDRNLQPIGAMSATVAGHEATIDALVAAGAVAPRDGSLAKIVLGVLARPSPVDGEPELTAPLSLQDGDLWIGPARLAEVPEVRWP